MCEKESITTDQILFLFVVMYIQIEKKHDMSTDVCVALFYSFAYLMQFLLSLTVTF